MFKLIFSAKSFHSLMSERMFEVINVNYLLMVSITTGSFGFERETPPANKIIVTTSRSHSDRMVTEAVEACNPDEVVRVGGAGHKVSTFQYNFFSSYNDITVRHDWA